MVGDRQNLLDLLTRITVWVVGVEEIGNRRRNLLGGRSRAARSRLGARARRRATVAVIW